MINPPLFHTLENAAPDKKVQISAEDEPARWSKAPSKFGYSSRKAYPVVEDWGECYRINCPFCGDTRGRLFFCHLAGAKVQVKGRKTPVHFSQFICVCHNERCHAERPEFREWLKALRLSKLEVIDLTTKHSPQRVQQGFSHLMASSEAALPSPCYPLSSSDVPARVLEYLHLERGLNPYELEEKHGVGYSPAGALYPNPKEAVESGTKPEKSPLRDERIVVPITMGRRLVGWQARLLREADKKDIKYFTDPCMQKSRALFNFDTAILGNVVVVVEGVFDVFRIGAPAVCLFGKKPSDAQKLFLKTAFGQTGGCIIMLDPEEADRTYELACEFYEENIFPRGVVPGYLPDTRDPAEVPYAEMKNILDRYIEDLLPFTPAGGANGTKERDMKELFLGFEELESEEI